MAENVTQRKEEDKKEQKSTNEGAECVVAKIKANCCHKQQSRIVRQRILGHANTQL